jgi:hypothetical protein
MSTNDLLLSFKAGEPFDEFEKAIESAEDAEFVEEVETE